MTLSREEDSSLRHWSARLIQALQILDLEVDHEKIVQVAEESVKAVGPHADAISAFIVGYAAGTASTNGRKGTQEAVHAASEQGHRAVRARRVGRPGRRRLDQEGPVTTRPCKSNGQAHRHRPCPRRRDMPSRSGAGMDMVGVMSSGRGQGLGMSRGGAGRPDPGLVPCPVRPPAGPCRASGVWSRLGSSRTMTALETGVLLPSAVWFSGTSTLASG